MKIKKYLIAGGNPTLLVWYCPPSQKAEITDKFFGEVEQVGFVSNSNGIPKLTMMGNELCVNATLAFASQLNEKGILQTSGIKSKVSSKNTGKITNIKLTLPFKQVGNIILFQGIGFILSDRKETPSKKSLSVLSGKYHLPAFGQINYSKNIIEPYVYVRKTDTLFAETACGSGSIAMNIATGFEKIIQPTEESIVVQRDGDYFEVSAKVVPVPLSKGLKNDIFR